MKMQEIDKNCVVQKTFRNNEKPFIKFGTFEECVKYIEEQNYPEEFKVSERDWGNEEEHCEIMVLMSNPNLELFYG